MPSSNKRLNLPHATVQCAPLSSFKEVPVYEVRSMDFERVYTNCVLLTRMNNIRTL
jgi:hypothetical protein